MLIGNSLFILLYLALCFFNRIAIDDFYFLSLAKQFDPIEATIVERSAWSARWCSVLLNQIVLSFHGSGYNLFFFGMIAGLLFILAVERILRRSGSENVQTDRWFRWNLSIFIVSAIFHSSFSIGQTWFWLCSACTYLIGAIMFLFGVSTLIGKKQYQIDMIICCIAFLYVGGSSEPLAVFVLALLLLLILISRSRTAIPLRMLSIAFTSCLIGFAILYSAEGNFKRASHFQDIGFGHAAVLNVKLSGMIVLRKLPSVLPIVLLFCIPAGIQLAYRIHIFDRKKVPQRIIVILMAFFISVYFFQLPITYATHDLGADRTLFPIIIFAIAAIAGVFFNLGTILDSHRTSIVRFALFAALVLNGYRLIDQLKVLPKYASAYDKRMEMLNQMKDKPGIIILDPLPASGLLLSAEISTDPLHFSNQHLRKDFGLKAQVKQSDPSTIDQR